MKNKDMSTQSGRPIKENSPNLSGIDSPKNGLYFSQIIFLHIDVMTTCLSDSYVVIAFALTLLIPYLCLPCILRTCLKNQIFNSLTDTVSFVVLFPVWSFH